MSKTNVKRYDAEAYCQRNVGEHEDMVVLSDRPHMLADKAPRVNQSCFVCRENTGEKACSIVLRGFPVTADTAESVTITAACLKHANALADILDKPYVNDGVKELGLDADLEALDTACVVCGGGFDDEDGVIGLDNVRLHVCCADDFVDTLRNIGRHSDSLLGVSL